MLHPNYKLPYLYFYTYSKHSEKNQKKIFLDLSWISDWYLAFKGLSNLGYFLTISIISIALFSSAVLHCSDHLNLQLCITYHQIVSLCNILLNVLKELVDDTRIVYACVFSKALEKLLLMLYNFNIITVGTKNASEEIMLRLCFCEYKYKTTSKRRPCA